MLQQCLNDKIKALTEDQVDLVRDSWVVLPLTTGLSVETRDDVIGFAVKDIVDPQVYFFTLPRRDWEVSAQYTGLTEEIYTAALTAESELISFLKQRPVAVCFAEGILVRAFKAIGAIHPVVALTKVAQLYYISRTSAVFESKGEDEYKEEGEVPGLKEVLAKISQVSVPRMLSRFNYAGEIGVDVDGLRNQYPAAEVNINIDAAILEKALLYSGTESDEVLHTYQ